MLISFITLGSLLLLYGVQVDDFPQSRLRTPVGPDHWPMDDPSFMQCHNFTFLFFSFSFFFFLFFLIRMIPTHTGDQFSAKGR